MVSDRIKKLLEILGIDSKSFAKQIGVEPSSISHLMSGRNKPSFNFLEKLAKTFPEVNIVWLLTGNGEPLNNSAGNYVKDKTLFADNETFTKGTYIENSDDFEKTQGDSAVKNKKVEKIVLIYTDGTFKIYDNENI